jgi:DDE superfamily endonuclease
MSDDDSCMCREDEVEFKVRQIVNIHNIFVQNCIANIQLATAVHDMYTVYQLTKYTCREQIFESKCSSNKIRDRQSVDAFIHTWSDEMFKRQFRLTREDFWHLYNSLLLYKTANGYDIEKHEYYANLSSGSPITLELRLYITLRMLSGASYLDFIWYQVDVNSVHSIFWNTICLINEAIDIINLPMDDNALQNIINSWSVERIRRHTVDTMYGTMLAVDGFVLQIKKPSPKSLNGKDVSCYRNRKGYWGLIAQVGVDSNARVVYVAVNWPGATNDITCFRETLVFSNAT